jgi:hypothetical protein
MGLSTVTESQLQRLSGSGVATATGDRTSPTPKQPRHPPIILVPLNLSGLVGAETPGRISGRDRRKGGAHRAGWQT